MSEKKSNGIALKIICAAIPLAALLIVLFCVLYPSAMARRERSAIVDRLESLTPDPAVSATVTDMSSYDLGITDEDSEVIFEKEDAAALAARLAEALKEAKYSGKKDAPGGSWDTRIRIFSASGDSVTLYLADDGRLYFVRGVTRFYFTPKEDILLPTRSDAQ